MLVMASDYVGCKALEILITKSVAVRGLVLHRRNPGNFNAPMIELYSRHLAPKHVPLIFDDEMNEDVIKAMSANRPDAGLLAWWPDIIRMPLLSLPRRGWVNMHPSFLPFNRGKHPNFWCLAEGTPCGVALHLATSSVDAGDIIARAELPVSWEDTGESVYKRSLELIVELFAASIDDIVQGHIRRTAQVRSEGSLHRLGDIESASRIDLDRRYRARELLNIIRGRMFKPHPTAYFVEEGKKYSVEIVIREMELEKNG